MYRVEDAMTAPAQPATSSPKQPYNLRRLAWIGITAALTLCACLAFIMFANRDNPSAVPTLVVEDLETAVANATAAATLESAQTVELSLNPHILGNFLIIEGQTDLPNQTLLMYEASEVSSNPKVETGTLDILDGRYLRQVDIRGWHAGTIGVWVGFQTLLPNGQKQSEAVIEKFGEMGEFLYGDNVTEINGLKRVEVTQTLEFVPR
jgi:hypothetical protein